MGKKRLRSKYTSKGSNVGQSRSVSNGCRAARTVAQVEINKVNAWLDLKNPWVTIANPDPSQTNKRMIRVRANDYFGNPRKMQVNVSANTTSVAH